VTIRHRSELEAMTAVGRLVGQTLALMAPAVAPGITTREIDEVGADFLRQHGARSAPHLLYNFPGCSCISVNDEVVHGIPGSRRIAAGDLVKLDVTAELDGFIADAAVTVPVPPVTRVGQALCDAARSAFELAMAIARPGERLAELGRVIDREVRAKGFSVLREVAGHGIGKTIHEPPDVLNYFNPHVRDRLEEGQVMAVEPIIAMKPARVQEGADGWTLRTSNGALAAHYEHTVMITPEGPRLLTAVTP
jgi:methionyl aminopeptidase